MKAFHSFLGCLLIASCSLGFNMESLNLQKNLLNVLKFNQASSDSRGDESDPAVAPPCDESCCRLSRGCFCSGTKIPGGIDPALTPQMIVLTFQNAVSQQNFGLYQQLFNGRVNPNGCPAVGTFFVSHNYTNYFQVQTLASQRHEIANNAVDEEVVDFWRTASLSEWVNELGSQTRILRKFANITRVNGVRVPYLEMGGDTQLTAMKYQGLTYDATRTSSHFNKMPNLLWPYTYTYASTQDCDIGTCPTSSFPDIWQLPILDFIDRNGVPCATPEGCSVTNEAEAYDLLIRAFTSHYVSNRAPLTIAMGTSWLVNDYKLKATLRFLDDISRLRDVYFVTGSQVIDWIRQPTPVPSIGCFKPWGCSQRAPPVCQTPNACHYYANRTQAPPSASDWQFNMPTCFRCPKCYPGVNDPYGACC